MATYLQLRNNIESDILRTDLTTDVNKAINEAIRFYKKTRFWFNEKRTTFNTTASQKYYGDADGVPTILDIINMKILINGSEDPLFSKPFTWIDNVDQNTYTGYPMYYGLSQTEADRRIWLYPVPNAVFTVTITYQADYADLSADGDTNDFTDNAPDLIEARAKKRLYKHVIKDSEQSQVQAAEEADQIDNLLLQTGHLLDGQALAQPTDF